METKVINNLIQIPGPPVTITLEQLDRNISTLERFIALKQTELENLKSHRENAVLMGVKPQVELNNQIIKNNDSDRIAV